LGKLRDERIRLEETITQAARACFQAMEPPKILPPKPDSRRKGEEWAVPFACDWHMGAHTPDFNIEVVRQRVAKYARKIIELAEIQRADHPVRRCRVWALGDLVAGERVFPGQEWEIDSSLIEQVVGEGMAVFRDFLLTLTQAFETVEVVCVPGNHGRMAPRHSPFSPDVNADRLLYLVTQQALAKVPSVIFTVARADERGTGIMLIDTIGKYRTLLTHGDLFRGSGGFAGLPFYSYSAKMLKLRDMQLSGEMDPFDDVAIGHWHRCGTIPVGSGVVRLGGTLLTWDPFSRETLAAATRPQQMLLFVHPERGVTCEYRVDLA
jgi:hypothetical protein